MAKIKHTKNELKAQRESLKRFERFLPMLILKKQQLQGEILAVDNKLAELTKQEEELMTTLKSWIKLFSEADEIENIVSLKDIKTDDGNIAGVDIPVFVDAIIETTDYDLFSTPSWYDDAVEMAQKLIRLRIHKETLEEQRRLLEEELRQTSQRVNLFEKVKIPECKENIRIIKIFLGDEQTAAVVRGKIAKGRTEDYQYEDEAA